MPTTVMRPDSATWDTFVQTHPRAHLLQTAAWGDLKAAFGWTPARVAISEGETIQAGAQVLFKRLPFRLGWWGYIPYGPLVDWDNPAQVNALFAAVDTVAREHKAAFLKVEPGFDLSGVDFGRFGLRPSPQTIQPPRTVLIDISGDEDAILARMNQGTRRNIRKSAKFEVVIREGSRAEVDSFNALIQRTGDRQDFGVHAPDYYERAYDLFVPQGRAALLLASYNGLDLAGVMVFAVGEWAWYLYGASSSQERQRMASYGVQWAAIQWARAQGARVYDMYGVPDADEAALEAQFNERSDGLWGVYRFKRGWGGDLARSVGTYDRIYSKVLYTSYRLALRG